MLLRRVTMSVSSLFLQLCLWSLSGIVRAQAPAPGTPQGEPPPPEPQPLPHPDLPPPTLPEVPADSTWLWILSSCATLGLIVLVWALFRRHVLAPPPLPKARRDALQALRRLRDQSDITPPSDTAAAVSSTVRQYLQIAYQLPAPRRTTRELFHQPDTPAPIRPLAPLADLWDRLAYGPPVDSRAEVHSLIDKAIAHLESESGSEDKASPAQPSTAA